MGSGHHLCTTRTRIGRARNGVRPPLMHNAPSWIERVRGRTERGSDPHSCRALRAVHARAHDLHSTMIFGALTRAQRSQTGGARITRAVDRKHTAHARTSIPRRGFRSRRACARCTRGPVKQLDRKMRRLVPSDRSEPTNDHESSSDEAIARLAAQRTSPRGDCTVRWFAATPTRSGASEGRLAFCAGPFARASTTRVDAQLTSR
jgi:hypothetical protein